MGRQGRWIFPTSPAALPFSYAAPLQRGRPLRNGQAYWAPLRFHVQEGETREWRRVVDTARPSPEDIADPGDETPLASLEYEVAPRSIVVLERER